MLTFFEGLLAESWRKRVVQCSRDLGGPFACSNGTGYKDAYDSATFTWPSASAMTVLPPTTGPAATATTTHSASETSGGMGAGCSDDVDRALSAAHIGPNVAVLVPLAVVALVSTMLWMLELGRRRRLLRLLRDDRNGEQPAVNAAAVGDDSPPMAVATNSGSA